MSTATIASQLSAGTWTVDPAHSSITFVVRHMMVSKVRGVFRDYSADITIGDDPLQSALRAEVQMSSIDTGNADRDEHLRTNDFFDIAQFPTMTLTATGLEPKGDDFVMTADLTIRGVTHSVAFDLAFEGSGTDPWGGTRAGFTAATTINRKDFGIEYNAALETGGVLIGDKVQIELEIQLVKA